MTKKIKAEESALVKVLGTGMHGVLLWAERSWL